MGSTVRDFNGLEVLSTPTLRLYYSHVGTGDHGISSTSTSSHGKSLPDPDSGSICFDHAFQPQGSTSGVSCQGPYSCPPFSMCYGEHLRPIYPAPPRVSGCVIMIGMHCTGRAELSSGEMGAHTMVVLDRTTVLLLGRGGFRAQ